MDIQYVKNTRRSDKFVFLSKFLTSPKQVGSVLPSSRYLTNKMLEPIDWDQVRAVAELGAGTGVFTRAINRRMHRKAQAVIFEADPMMRNRLKEQSPNLNYWGDATELNHALQQFGMGKLDVVFSGLPFANFEQDMRDKLLSEVVESLKPGGKFIAFQYSLQMKKQLQERFRSVKIGFVPMNVPPAFVYICQK
ncbi:class I SAM-dependent methyltransferase [Tumebacillus algifaecis]|uniref:class I SAM-dependent methyltransferase n=1 Tax=Tumebacillus algifaecis TaxID=1214604 RepID=UPI001D1323C2|nr:methyltransferase domain-containing protein [Tumebacillus algifaecis]